jgi:hypothetical protein
MDQLKAQQTGQALLAALADGKLQPFGMCQYISRSEKPCAVGFLLTPEERERVAYQGFNSQNIRAVVERGLVNDAVLYERTGLTLDALAAIQASFDEHDNMFFEDRVKKECGL